MKSLMIKTEIKEKKSSKGAVEEEIIISEKVDRYLNNLEVNRDNKPLGLVKDYYKLFK